jgi:UDP-glucose 4-epimerase
LDETLLSGHGALCERFDQVVAIDTAAPKEKLSKTRFFRVDLTEDSADAKLAEIFARENVSTVVHLAVRHNPHRNASAAHELHSVGTMYMLNACAAQQVKKIIVHSSTFCYGAFPNNPNFLAEDRPLRGGSHASFIRDRIDIENQMQAYQRQYPACVVTLLRPCATVGPNVDNFATRYLSRKICLTPLGFDPLMQLVHEDDVLQGFQLALEKDARGAFNIVGDGVLPLMTLLRLAGRISLPVASLLLYPTVQALWHTNVGIVPPGTVDFIRYLWVADGDKARRELGFKPRHTTREAVLAFVSAERLKAVGLSEVSDAGRP